MPTKRKWRSVRLGVSGDAADTIEQQYCVRGEGGGDVLERVKQEVVKLDVGIKHGLHQAAPHLLKSHAEAHASTATSKVLLQPIFCGCGSNLTDELVHVVLVLLHDCWIELGDTACLSVEDGDQVVALKHTYLDDKHEQFLHRSVPVGGVCSKPRLV